MNGLGANLVFSHLRRPPRELSPRCGQGLTRADEIFESLCIPGAASHDATAITHRQRRLHLPPGPTLGPFFLSSALGGRAGCTDLRW